MITCPATRRVDRFLPSHAYAITTSEAHRLGLTTHDLRRLVRNGRLKRVGRGAYICAERAREDEHARHRAAVEAMVRARGGSVVASHTSAAVVHRLPLLRRDLTRLHLAQRGDSEGRRHDTFTVHRCPGPDAFTLVDGLGVVVPALAVVQTSMAAGVESGMMAADAALRRGVATREELDLWVERLRHAPGLGAARHVTALACPSAESPGESLTRLVLRDLGHDPVPQCRIIEEDGRVIARVDFLLPELGVVVEFDGQVKYEGHDGAQALAAEKRREDRIRALGTGWSGSPGGTCPTLAASGRRSSGLLRRSRRAVAEPLTRGPSLSH